MATFLARCGRMCVVWHFSARRFCERMFVEQCECVSLSGTSMSGASASACLLSTPGGPRSSWGRVRQLSLHGGGGGGATSLRCGRRRFTRQPGARCLRGNRSGGTVAAVAATGSGGGIGGGPLETWPAQGRHAAELLHGEVTARLGPLAVFVVGSSISAEKHSGNFRVAWTIHENEQSHQTRL